MVRYEVVSFVIRNDGNGPVQEMSIVSTEDDSFALNVWEDRMKNTVVGVGKPIWQHEVRKIVDNGGINFVSTVMMGIGNYREY